MNQRLNWIIINLIICMQCTWNCCKWPCYQKWYLKYGCGLNKWAGTMNFYCPWVKCVHFSSGPHVLIHFWSIKSKRTHILHREKCNIPEWFFKMEIVYDENVLIEIWQILGGKIRRNNFVSSFHQQWIRQRRRTYFVDGTAVALITSMNVLLWITSTCGNK